VIRMISYFRRIEISQWTSPVLQVHGTPDMHSWTDTTEGHPLHDLMSDVITA
jgi:hypothetical protein